MTSGVLRHGSTFVTPADAIFSLILVVTYHKALVTIGTLSWSTVLDARRERLPRSCAMMSDVSTIAISILTELC